MSSLHLSQPCLVTGGAGYIGSHLVYRLIESGFEVVVLDNLSRGNVRLLHPKSHFIRGSVGDSALIRSLIQQYHIQTIYHFAAFIDVEESNRIPYAYYQNNTCLAMELIQTAVSSGVKAFVFSSTAAVYGAPESAKPLAAAAHLAPLNPYGYSKWITEVVLQDLTKGSSMKYAILRYFNAAGARADSKLGQLSTQATHLIKVACQVSLGQRPHLVIHGVDYPTPDGTCIRDYIHVEDLVSAHLKAVDYLKTGGESSIFNLGSEKGFSVREVIRAFEKVSGQPLKVVEGPRRQGDSPFVVANAQKAKRVLEWTPSYSKLEAICGSALNWEKTLLT